MQRDSDVAAVMEVTGCAREAAVRAVEAAGEGGLELAVELVLSSTSDWASADDELPPAPTSIVRKYITTGWNCSSRWKLLEDHAASALEHQQAW